MHLRSLSLPLNIFPIRVFIELVVVFSLVELAIMGLMPLLGLQMTALGTAMFDALSLALVATPVAFWRLRAAQRRGVASPEGDVRLARRPVILAVSIFLLATLTGALSAWQLNAESTHLATERFNGQVARLEATLKQRLEKPYYGIRATKALVTANPGMKRDVFVTFWRSTNIQEEFPGVRGFGFIEHVERGKLADFIERQRRDGAPQFTVRSVGDAQDLFIVKLIEPLANNLAALGYDIGSETLRRQAAEDAVRSGAATRTAKITLVQDGQKRPGFLYFIPVFSAEAPGGTEAERRRALRGIAFSPVVVEELIGNAVLTQGAELAVSLFDEHGMQPDDLLFENSAQVNPVPRYEVMRELTIGGRPMFMRVRSTTIFDEQHFAVSPAMRVLFGMLFGTLLAWAILLIASGRDRAVRLANQMTNELNSAMRRLQSANDQMVQVIEFSPMSLLVVSGEGIIEMANTASETVFGYRKAEMIGQPVEMLVPQSVRGKHVAYRENLAQRPVEQVMQNGRDLRGRRSDGSEFPAEVALRKIVLDDKPHILVTTIDLSVRKAIEAELISHRNDLQIMVTERTAVAEQAREVAERANQAKSVFLQNMSHELRTPLHAVLSFSALGTRRTEGVVDPELLKLRNYFVRVNEAGQNLRSLLDNLLQITDFQSRLMNLTLQQHSLVALARQVADGFRTSPGPVIELSAVDADEHFNVICDAEKISSLLTHLIDNARRYARESVVEVSFQRLPAVSADVFPVILCRVSDHGPGIPLAERETVFNVFTESTASASAAGGRGLGLAICRDIVDAHGGRIWIEETAGGGCTVLFSLRPSAT